MRKIYLLTDYKDHFGLKHNSEPYRSGMDKALLKEHFKEESFKPIFKNFSEVHFRKDWKNEIVLYTSQEDESYHYKSYIEDVVYGLDQSGAQIIPQYKYLRAHNNKVFMEILREQAELQALKSIKSRHFGTKEELDKIIETVDFPVVLKKAEGAMGSNVTIAKNEKELKNKVAKLSRTQNISKELWDLGRSIKHKNYKRESKYRGKFIIQDFIPELENDWKILVYGNKFFVFKRGVRKNDFRASGSGQEDYEYGSNCQFPQGMLGFAKKVFNSFKVPQLSIDIGYDGNDFYLFEFQAIHFGTVGHEKSDIFYKNEGSNFEEVENTYSLEEIYVESIVSFLGKK